MRKLICLATILIALAGGALAESDERKEELDQPNVAPDLNQVDHDAILQRSIQVLETQFGAWRDASITLENVAATYCGSPNPDRDTLDAALRDAWLAWAPLDSYQFGPIEQTSAVLSVNFWPDKKNFVGKALKQLLAKPEDEQRLPSTVGALSSAAQGYPAIEMLLHSDMTECPAIVGISGHLTMVADDLIERWFAPDGWADLARAAGPDNPVYLSTDEFTKTLYTAVDFGLTRVADTRLGRPLGTPTLPFPRRAEAWRSGLTNALIGAQMDGLSELIFLGLASDISDQDGAQIANVFEQVQGRLDDIGMPISKAVESPMDRFRVEALQTQVHYLQSQIAQDLGPNLGVDTGFSAADGD